MAAAECGDKEYIDIMIQRMTGGQAVASGSEGAWRGGGVWYSRRPHPGYL